MLGSLKGLAFSQALLPWYSRIDAFHMMTCTIDEAVRRAIAAYGQAALNAFQEVETSLDQNVVLRQRNQLLAVAAEEANEALRVFQLRHREGDVDLLSVLQVQQRVLSADSNLLSVDRARLTQWVNLNLALGGTWE